jgi:hypothetical protein
MVQASRLPGAGETRAPQFWRVRKTLGWPGSPDRHDLVR